MNETPWRNTVYIIIAIDIINRQQGKLNRYLRCLQLAA
jgi:hypothetical protein